MVPASPAGIDTWPCWVVGVERADRVNAVGPRDVRGATHRANPASHERRGELRVDGRAMRSALRALLESDRVAVLDHAVADHEVGVVGRGLARRVRTQRVPLLADVGVADTQLLRAAGRVRSRRRGRAGGRAARSARRGQQRKRSERGRATAARAITSRLGNRGGSAGSNRAVISSSISAAPRATVEAIRPPGSTSTALGVAVTRTPMPWHRWRRAAPDIRRARAAQSLDGPPALG